MECELCAEDTNEKLKFGIRISETKTNRWVFAKIVCENCMRGYLKYLRDYEEFRKHRNHAEVKHGN